MEIAEKEFGITVEKRPVHKDELSDFAEVGACGTAVVVTPVEKIISEEKTYVYGSEIGPVLKKLYDRMTGIQFGEYPDEHGWLVEVKE
jgi:branched-chain amino acid aminotransferase